MSCFPLDVRTAHRTFGNLERPVMNRIKLSGPENIRRELYNVYRWLIASPLDEECSANSR